MKATQETSDAKQVAVHNVIHPYHFSRDMLMNMVVVNQLDDKFIVGVVPDNKVGTAGGEEVSLIINFNPFTPDSAMSKVDKFSKFTNWIKLKLKLLSVFRWEWLAGIG